MSLYEAVFTTLKQWWVSLIILTAFFIVYFGITDYLQRAKKKKRVSDSEET